MDESRGQSGLNRVLNAKLTTHTVLTLVVVLSVALAGCTGMGGLGDSGGDENGAADDDNGAAGDDDAADEDEDDADEDDDADADETDSSDSDDPDSIDGEGADVGDDWFDLSQPGHYAFDLAGMDEETGEQVTGHLVYDIEGAGEEVTTSVDYEFGSEQYQSTITAPGDEVMGQLFLTPAHKPILALQSVSLQYFFEMGFTDPSVGNRKQTTTDEGTQVTEVTEKRSYAGLECSFVETTVDGERSQQSCLRDSEAGIAPYVATYTDEGDLELEVELVAYESG